MPLVKLGVTKPNSHHKVLVPLKYDKKIKSLEGIVKEATFANKIFMGKTLWKGEALSTGGFRGKSFLKKRCFRK